MNIYFLSTSFNVVLRLSSILTAFFLAPVIVACPLQGTWDSGFVPSKNGGSLVRVTQEFDCAGNTTLRAFYTRGMMLQAMAEVIERTGFYQVSGAAANGLRTVDITVQNINKRVLDPSTLESLRNGSSDCHPDNFALVVSFPLNDRNCDKGTFPSVGQIERGVFAVEENQLFWSYFYGDEIVVIQSPEDTLKRHFSVDRELPFRKL